MSGPDSESVVKALAAESWCNAINKIESNSWEYWMVIDKDARRCETVDELNQIAKEWKELMT